MAEKKRRRKNLDFKLGLNRKQLIEAAVFYGKSEAAAKKSSTAKLESFVFHKIAGRERRFEELTPEERKKVQQVYTRFSFGENDPKGLMKAIQYISFKLNKRYGLDDRQAFLRTAIAQQFMDFYDGPITQEMIDELERRLPQAIVSIESDIFETRANVRFVFEEYAEELMERERTNRGRR